MDAPRTQSTDNAVEHRPQPRRRAARAAVLLAALLPVGVLSVSAGAAPTCTDTFTGTSGGGWTVAANWTTDASTHVIPTSSDVVCLGTSTVLISTGAQSAGSIEDGTGSLDITGGSLTLVSTAAASAIKNFALDDTGSFTAPATQTVTVTGSFEWGQESTDEQQQLLNAVINQTGGGSFAIDGDPTGSGLGGPQLTGAAAITTSSPVSITNGLFGATGAQTLTTTGTITVGPVQLDALTSEATITAAAIAAQPANAGAYGFWDANLVLTGGTTNVATNTTLEAGNLTLEGGTIDAVGDISPPPGYALDAMTLDSGTLTGAGDIHANVTNVGALVSPPGGAAFSQLTVTGTYTQDSGGTLAIGMDQTDTSILRVFDGATLAGNLSVTDLDGAPSAGQEFDVLLDSSTTGTLSLTGPSATEYAVSYPTGSAGGAVRLTAGAGAVTTTTSTTDTTTSAVVSTTTNTSANVPPATTTTTAVAGPTTTTTTSTAAAVTTTTTSVAQPTSTGTPVDSASPGNSGTPAAGGLRCPRPSGRVGGLSVGPLAVGFTRAHARRTLTHFTVTKGGLDDFCLDGGRDIRVAYPTSRILSSAAESLRPGLRGRVVLALTSDPFYALDGAKPGGRLSAARELHLSPPIRLGASDWYVVPGKLANGVLKVHAGVITEVGLVNRRLSTSRTAQRLLLSAYASA